MTRPASIIIEGCNKKVVQVHTICADLMQNKTDYFNKRVKIRYHYLLYASFQFTSSVLNTKSLL